MDTLDSLPLSCIVNSKFIAIHGGISPNLRSLNDIKKLNRFSEPPKQGLFCDLLWSDPVDNDTGNLDSTYKANDVRGCAYYFGKDALKKFLD